MAGVGVVAIRISANAIAVALCEVICVYRRSRTIDRIKLKQLQIQVEAALRMEWGRYAGSLARVHIDEIATTQRQIDSLDLRGPALRGAMFQLEVLSGELANSLKEFRLA